MRLLITGSEGLVGERLRQRCQASGVDVVGVDMVATAKGSSADIRTPEQWASRVGPVDGVVHLAAISRVAWGERDPALCNDVNENGT